MGHVVVSMPSDFRIRSNNLPKAFMAIQSLAGRETVTKANFPGKKNDDHFAFVDPEKLAQAFDFFSAMEAWRWFLDENESGDAVDPFFLGEKLGDEAILFEAIAPFVEHGGYIQMVSVQEGTIWRWRFSKGKVRVVEGKVVF